MTPIDGDRARLAASAPVSPDTGVPRSEAGLHFEAALRHGHSHHDGGHGDDEDRDSPARRPRQALWQPARGLPASLVGLFQESIEQGFPTGLNENEVLGALTRHIVDGVRVGRRMSGDRWRLMVRLRDDVLPATALEIAGVDGQLIVTLRSADVGTHLKLTQALPHLDRVLSERGYHGPKVAVFLVGAEALP